MTTVAPSLPGFPFTSQHVEVGGHTMAYVDEGTGPAGPARARQPDLVVLLALAADDAAR